MSLRPDKTTEVLCGCLSALVAMVATGLVGELLLRQSSTAESSGPRTLIWCVFFWVVCGGLFLLLVSMVTWFRRAREKSRARRLADAASALGLKHSLEPLPYFRRYRALDILLTHTNLDSKLQNHLYGQFKSQPVDIVDYEYWVGDGENTKEYACQTIFFFSSAERKLPVFRMQPQTATKLERTLLGEPGTVFWRQEPKAKAEHDDGASRSRHEFHDNYEITCGYSPTQRRLVDVSPNVPSPAKQDSLRLESQLRELFDESLLQFFAHQPGWHVESSGRYLAVWEKGRFTEPSELEDQLLSALEVADQVQGALPRPKTKADTTRRVETVTGVQQKTQRAISVVSSVLGAAFGSITSGLTAFGTIALFRQSNPRYGIIIDALPLVFLAIVFGLLVGVVGGLVIGARVIGPAMRASRRPGSVSSCTIRR